jgi:hypothetical protein
MLPIGSLACSGTPATARLAASCSPSLPRRRSGPILGIRSHDQQITRLTLIAVRDAGRHHNDIACLNPQHCPARAAEQYGGLTPGNTKDLVCRTMKVVKRVLAVAPCRGPAIGGEGRSMAAGSAGTALR